ncbi:FAD-dependent monooxygenase [Curvibacter sp. CHRR-16]|uniref:FAD-dependent monooxygenase n=1 Tax=Curvibacter sp. CHRR-16 TaxID=2835872 RepID=UPI001BD9C2C8|nr:FAD-dependent monooxygenase [Curvibacter sp. CHRR-16]MBT0568821.1 FAD-dependent monooxygenase [Curvibacter sp. CHRR-16]
MTTQFVIVGGGIGGLASAVALGLRKHSVQVLEQASAFGEVGAGVQLGPNVTRVLQAWGLGQALDAVACRPERLVVRNALSGAELASLPLGSSAEKRYGAPYVTIARPDLHSMLLAKAFELTQPRLQTKFESIVHHRVDGVEYQLQDDATLHHADVLVGADGVWSRVRQHLLPHLLPQPTGHLAYRAMVPQRDLPAALRSQVVTAWMGPAFHVVQYPVRGGDWLNVVAIVHGHLEGDLQTWDHQANASELRARLAQTQAPLLDLLHAIDHWRLWPLYATPPMAGAAHQAQGRLALLGDAAHPMRPYLAQGAGMAIEDAQQLAASWQLHALQPTLALQHYARARWQRNAMVQAKAERNGRIFHLRGPLRWARDWALRTAGQQLMDQPWLYGYRSPV